jgi:hypothetical protein
MSSWKTTLKSFADPDSFCPVSFAKNAWRMTAPVPSVAPIPVATDWWCFVVHVIAAIYIAVGNVQSKHGRSLYGEQASGTKPASKDGSTTQLVKQRMSEGKQKK